MVLRSALRVQEAHDKKDKKHVQVHSLEITGLSAGDVSLDVLDAMLDRKSGRCRWGCTD